MMNCFDASFPAQIFLIVTFCGAGKDLKQGFREKGIPIPALRLWQIRQMTSIRVIPAVFCAGISQNEAEIPVFFRKKTRKKPE